MGSFYWAALLLCDIGKASSLLDYLINIPQFWCGPTIFPSLSSFSSCEGVGREKASLSPPRSSGQKPADHSSVLLWCHSPSAIHAQLPLEGSQKYCDCFSHPNPSHHDVFTLMKLLLLQFGPLEIFPPQNILFWVIVLNCISNHIILLFEGPLVPSDQK